MSPSWWVLLPSRDTLLALLSQQGSNKVTIVSFRCNVNSFLKPWISVVFKGHWVVITVTSSSSPSSPCLLVSSLPFSIMVVLGRAPQLYLPLLFLFSILDMTTPVSISAPPQTQLTLILVPPVVGQVWLGDFPLWFESQLGNIFSPE